MNDTPSLGAPWWIQFLKFYGLPAVLLVAVLWRADAHLDRIITNMHDGYTRMGEAMVEHVSGQRVLQEELVKAFKEERVLLERIVEALEND